MLGSTSRSSELWVNPKWLICSFYSRSGLCYFMDQLPKLWPGFMEIWGRLLGMAFSCNWIWALWLIVQDWSSPLRASNSASDSNQVCFFCWGKKGVELRPPADPFVMGLGVTEIRGQEKHKRRHLILASLQLFSLPRLVPSSHSD